ncbi:breast cancer type 2 susceptibility protein isoform X1 [Thamnophis elegans]|uniref:breast cancer type 2 susceptibility protein isoform X1 n=1 Tax=Thamnophis elegans TaxID=35005 RepID=UPI00137811C9|nr:breast cancer type 2 susceptibility protein isoform X1 [Thamnophis elegans]
MEKKNVDISAKKPSLFEIFKTQYSESDLGPISLNWFEELSSEAPPFDVKITEDPLYKTMDQNTFKTPKGKLSMNNSSVSTPMIFKDRNKNLKTSTSPVEKSAQSSEETGKTYSEMPRLRTQVDESNEGMNLSRSCVIASPVIQEKQKNKYVLNESLLQTPKIFEVQTQKCISESLGAEADPDMSWTSSLATPPTLSPTVIIERRNDSVSGTKIHNEIIDITMCGLFSKHGKSLKSNNINRQSSSGIEISHAEMDNKIHTLESFLNESFDKNAFPVELQGSQKPSNVPKDEDNHGGMSDFSLNIASSSVFLKKINSVEENKKALFYEKNHDELEKEHEMIKASNETKFERKLKSSKCNLNTNVPKIQNAMNRKENMTSSLLCPWSQLDLSGFELTQLEKKFVKSISSSSTLQVKKTSPGSPSSIEKKCSSPKILKSSMLNTPCVIQHGKMSSPEKLSVSENSPLLIKNDSVSLKHAEDEEFFSVNFSKNNYFLMNRTLTESSEVQSIHSDFSRKDKSSSGHHVSNQGASDGRQHTKSSLKNISSLSSLKRRPKKFIYALNNSLVQREKGTTQRDGSLTCFVPVCTNLETGTSELSEILIKNEGQIETADHSTKERKQIDSEKCYTSTNMLYETKGSNKSNIEHNTSDSSALLLKNNMKKEAVMFSRDLAANYQTEVTEKGFHEICHSNTLVDRKTDFTNYSSSQEALIEACTVPMQVSETENKQVTLELTAQLLDSGIHSTKASKSITMLLEQEMDTKLSPLLSLKEGAHGDKQRELECLCLGKIQKGFKTASDKQIVLSDDKIRKGKLLFKDIEDRLLEDFQNEEKSAISSQNKQENAENFSVGQNELNSHVSDSVVNFIHSDDTKIGFPEYGNKSVQNVLKNQHPEEKHNLTASQVAEITELSNILEETDSQFEFTQFRKHKTMMYNNTNETRCLDKKCLNSKNCKDMGFVDNPGDNQSSFKHIDTWERNTDRQSNNHIILLESNRKENNCFVPVISDPLQSDLGNHSSVKNKDEITRRGTELASNKKGMGEILNSYKIKMNGSNKCSSWHMPMKEIDIDWPQKAKKGNAEYIIQGTTKDTTIAFVKENTENKLKDVDCHKDSVVQITSTTEVNLKIIQKYSVHISENELLSTKNQNALSVHFVNCGKTCCNNNCPETLSDLTCLVEVAKTEKNNTWNDAGAKESFISEQEEKVNKPEKQYFLQSVHTVTDGNTFAEKSKRLNLLTGSDIQEEINNMSYCKRKTNARHKQVIPSMNESTELNQTEIFLGCNHKNVSENREKQTDGFHTASGKQITFTDKSLLKARHLLSEEALCGNMNNTGSLIKFSVEDSVKKNFTFGEGGEKCREIGHSKDNFEDSLGVLSNMVKQGLKSGLIFKGLALNINASESYFHGGKKISILKEAYKNQDWMTSKCDLHLLDTGTLQKYPTNEARTSTSKQSKVNPPAFSFKTASDKTVKVSPKALKNAQQFLHKNYSNLLGSSLDAFGSKNCITSGYLNVEEMPMGYLDVSQFPTTKELCRTAQTLPCAMPMVVDTVFETNRETSDKSFEMGKCFNTWVSTKGNCISDFSTNKCMFFSTASGKPVQLSKESLNKARQFFSEIEPNLSGHQNFVSDDNFSCNKIHTVKNMNASESDVNAGTNANISGETCQNENWMTPKCSSHFLDISTLEKSSTNGEKDSPSKQLKARPAAFSFTTASGKTVNVSQKALKNAQHFLHKNLNNLESQSEINKGNTFGSSSDACGSRDCIGSSYLRVEKIPTEYSGLTQFPVTKKICESSQALSCVVPKSMETVPELNCKASDDFIEMHTCSDTRTSNKKKCKSDFSTDNCGFFSTASGKPVQLSKESLKKASLLFSEIESDLSVYQNSDPDCNYDYNTVNSNRKKIFPRENKLHISQRRENPNVEEHSGIPCDFNKACGKQVKISHKALQNVMGLLKEFDDINASDFFVDESLNQTHNSPIKTPITKVKQEHEANSSSKLKEKCKTRENLNENKTIKSLLNIEIPMSITSTEKYKQPAEFKRRFSCSKELTEPLKITQPCQSRVSTKYASEGNLDCFCPAYSQTSDNYSDVEASESAKAFIEDDDFTDSEVQRNIQKSILTANNSLLRTRSGKRHLEKENTFGQPPIKRKLLPEFEQSEKSSRSPFKSSPYDITKMTTYLQYARNLQQMRITKKQDQIIHPQPGSLYLVKRSSGLCRIPLKASVKEKLPDFYSSEQLYVFGVSKQCIKINSTNAEDFQFLIQDFFSKKYFLEDHGIQLADGGYIIPNDEGKAGKEEFFWALCDTPGVDPNLISKAWVYNHYKWIVWKLAAMEVAFPLHFASKCLTPEGVLLQLKFRYDIEVDKSQRSAIKRITERDDVAGKTIILCISKIISLSTNMPHSADSKSTTEDNKKEVAIIEVTDGWYGIRAVLDPPLQSLLSRQKLTVGQKIVVHGAELVGSQDASTPLEAPETLMLKITANSTRRARWYAKLGYYRDPRPFSLPLCSLFSDGGTVGCIDVIVQRIYPLQWMEKLSTGSCVFRNDRAEQREAAKFAENRQKTLEALLAKVQAKFEETDDKGKRILRSHALTRQQIRGLQDGAELYEAIINSADPSYMEGFFNEDQLKALNSHRQMVNDKRRAQIEAEFRKAVESAEQEKNSSCRRDVSNIIKLRIVDYGTKENSKEVILNIWRPPSHVCSLLKEGGRYRILQLSASHSKGKLKTSNVQLTATKKTQYLQLPVSQESLLQVYRPRECLLYDKLMEPSFRPPCSEVDLVGYVVYLTKRAGFSTLVYLSDEHHNIIAIQICTDLKLFAIEDIIIPYALISATNLQWRPEFKSQIPTLFAGELSAFSSNPKEKHLQEIFEEFKNAIQNDGCFSKEAQCKVMNFLKSDPLHLLNFSKECGLDPPWKCDAGNKQAITIPNSELRHQSPLTIGKLDTKPSFSLGSAKVTPDFQETPKNCKKRKAMDLLSRVPSPPPVKPICIFISPPLKKAFQPPRSSCGQSKTSIKKTERKNSKHPLLKLNGADYAPETNFVADEELAMINTQDLLSNFSEEQGIVSMGDTEHVISNT